MWCWDGGVGEGEEGEVTGLSDSIGLRLPMAHVKLFLGWTPRELLSLSFGGAFVVIWP